MHGQKVKDPPDGGWGWMVMVAATIQFFLNRGIQSAMAVLYIQFMDNFGKGAATTSWIPAIFSALNFCTGVSFGLISVPTNICLGRYFKRRYALANSIAVTGNGLGSFTMPLLCQFLINMYGWRGTLVIFASIAANFCVSASLLRPIFLKSDFDKVSSVTGAGSMENEDMRTDDVIDSNCPTQNTDDNFYSEKMSNLIVSLKARVCNLMCFFLPLFKERPLSIVYVVYQFMYGFGLGIMLSHFVDNAVVKNTSQEKAALLMSLMGLISCASCLATGIAMSCANVTKGAKYVHCFGVATFGVLALCTPFVKSFSTLVVITVFLGLARGTFSALDQVVVKEVVGTRRLTEGMGITVFFLGSGYLLGPPTSGYLFDRSGSYNLSFYCAGLVMICGSTLLPIAWIFRKARDKYTAV
ncbi:monocarboxylate transporter 12-like [Glandiceps talaboti]